MISALILAAGASRRMGSPKALLSIGETTFLRHIVETLAAAGITDVVVVLGADIEKIKPTLGWFDGAIVENADWEKGQLSSIAAGMEILLRKKVEGVILWPVDHPLIGPDLIVDMVEAFERSGRKIVLPVFKGRRGHPVLFSSEMFPSLMSASLLLGAKEVVRRHPEEIEEVSTSTEGILRNIDTPDDLRSAAPLSHIAEPASPPTR